MKASVKYKQNTADILPGLKKEYDIYVCQTGYPVIDVLNTEIPIFPDKLKQQFKLSYKLSREDEGKLSPDRNGFYWIDLTISIDEETRAYCEKVFTKKRKQQEKQRKEEEELRKKQLVDQLAAGKAKKKSELSDDDDEIVFEDDLEEFGDEE